MRLAARFLLFAATWFFLPLASPFATVPVIDTVAGGGPDNVPARSADIFPDAVVVDASGALYISSKAQHRIYRVDVEGILTVIAGTGFSGFRGDGGPARDALLNRPGGLAVSGTAKLYVADTDNLRIRRIDLVTGVIDTIAGGGPIFVLGDGGPATQAFLGLPGDVAVDSSGNLIIADNFNNRIRLVDVTSGLISTVAGNGTSAVNGDGGPALSAGIGRPDRVAVDLAGNIYVVHSGLHRVRRIDVSTGIIDRFAGTGSGGFSGDGGQAKDADLGFPIGISTDVSGNVFISDAGNIRIRKVHVASGVISTVAGNGMREFTGDGGPAEAAGLASPTDVWVDVDGNLYIADHGNFRVRRVDNADLEIMTVAGNGDFNFSGDGELATGASFGSVYGVVVDKRGNYYISDQGSHRIRRVEAGSGIINTIAGTGDSAFTGDGGPALMASLRFPAGMDIDSAGNIYFADQENNRVRRVDALTGQVMTVAGGGNVLGDGGLATDARLATPQGLSLSDDKSLYIADGGHHRVRRVDLQTGIITTVAGVGKRGFSGDGGLAVLARLQFPTDVVVDSEGNIYIADASNNRVRRIDKAQGNKISTIAGNGQRGFSGDGGTARLASLSAPIGIALDGRGNLFIADRDNKRIRRVDSLTGRINTVAGNGEFGFRGDGGSPLQAQLAIPTNIAVNRAGNVFLFTDRGNKRMRRVVLENLSLLADAGQDQTIECSSALGAVVKLDASASQNPGFGSLTFTWAGSFGTITVDEPVIMIEFPLGRHVLTLTVEDSVGTKVSDTVIMTVQDTISPAIDVVLDPVSLWPPNHRMVNVKAMVNATDSCGVVSIVRTSIVSNEPDDASGSDDGNTSADIQDGADKYQFRLRAERSGTGDGRIYSVAYAATDSSGNEAMVISSVHVPHEQTGLGLAEPLLLSVEDTLNGTVVRWNEIYDAQSYNVIRGSLSDLLETASVIDIGPLACIEERSLDTSTEGWEDQVVPAVGTGFFYLVEYRAGGNSSYGSETVGKPRTPGPGACE